MHRFTLLWIGLLWCSVMARVDIQLAQAQAEPSLAELTDDQRQLVKVHLPLGPPGPSTWVVREGYVLSYNSERQIPNWVAYHVTPDLLLQTEGEDLGSLRLDADVDKAPDPDSPWPNNYVPTRLTPREVMRRDDPTEKSLLIEQANSMGNVVFLDQRGLGAREGLWRGLQDWVQVDLVANRQLDVWVIAGCVVGQQAKVPPMIFQVVYRPHEQGEVEALAFLLPQHDNLRGGIGDFIVPLEVIEEVTGLKFFPDLPDRRIVWKQVLPRDESAASSTAIKGAPDEIEPFPVMEEEEMAEDSARKLPAAVGTPPYEIIPVFYGTDRRVDPSISTTGTIRKREELRNYYGSTQETPGALHLGICRVSVPTRPNGKPREIGTIPLPGVFKSAQRRDHFMLTELERLEVELFRSQLNETINLLPVKKQVFVYIHGFNNSFEEAAYRAAQMFVDLDRRVDSGPGVKCVPIMYTWPSKGSPTKYKEDRAQVKRSVKHIQEFLRIVARETDAEVIHLIAHSMGTQLLTSALADLPAGKDGDLPHINQIILAAPDIDAQEFVSEIAPKIERFGERFTIYQSNRDNALFLSQFIMNDPGIPRLGLRPIDLSETANESKFNQVDATWVAVSDVGHTYFGNVSDIIGDVRKVLEGQSLEKRNMGPSYLMRGKVEPWKGPPAVWYLVALRLLPGAAIGTVLMCLVGLFRRRKLPAKS